MHKHSSVSILHLLQFRHHKLFKAPIKRSPGPGATWTSKNESESVHSQPPPQSGPFTPEQKKSGCGCHYVMLRPLNSSVLSPEFRASRSSDPFNEFMKTLRKPAAQDIVQHLKSLAMTMLTLNMLHLHVHVSLSW